MKKTMIITLTIITAVALTTILVLRQDKFGKLPSGERLARIEKSTNYKNGKFQNLSPTPELTEGVSMWDVIKETFFTKKVNQKPLNGVPSKKIDLHHLNPEENILVWFGHSSYFLQVDGKKILIDPVLSGHASPFSFSVKAFKGADAYSYGDIPEVDYLFITHDHWDHLDYKTVMALKTKLKNIICPLGVGSHFEHWGFDNHKVTETDWNDITLLDSGFVVHTMPTRHFSGRGLTRNKTLWASFVFKTPNTQLYFGGDSGYDTHFREIGDKFGSFDLVLLENGQYDNAWRYIHMHPHEVLIAAKELNAKNLLPGHSGKFDLANHEWDTPLKTITELHKDEPFILITPTIGEKVVINGSKDSYTQWWEHNKSKEVAQR